MAPTPILSSVLAESSSFAFHQHGHKDMVEAAAFNTYGNRFALGSADGRIKVFDKMRDGTWKPCDIWSAHGAEIIEVQWLPSTLQPHVLASISLDGFFKLFVESPHLPILSGRRFLSSITGIPSTSVAPGSVYSQRCPPRTPFLSFSLHHSPQTRTTYLALLDRSGMLTVYENDTPENMSSWNLIDEFNCAVPPPLGAEASFCVRFDPNLEPCFNAIRAGVPRDSLGLIVSAMDKVIIWRSKSVVHTVTLGAGSSREFYIAAELGGHRGLVRDVSWASGSMRGYDVVASVCKDGFVRVWEVHTVVSNGNDRIEDDNKLDTYARYPRHRGSAASTVQRTAEGVTRSGIGAGLATTRSGSNAADQRQHDRAGQVQHVVKEVGTMDSHHGPVWRCRFDEDGQLLGTVGDDGKVMLWRRKPNGIWAESGELGITRDTIVNPALTKHITGAGAVAS